LKQELTQTVCDAVLARYMLSSCVCRLSVCHKTVPVLNQNGYKRRITQITPYDSSVSGTKHYSTHRHTEGLRHVNPSVAKGRFHAMR